MSSSPEKTPESLSDILPGLNRKLTSELVREWRNTPVRQGQRPPDGTPNIATIRKVLLFYSLGTDKIIRRDQLLKNLEAFLEDGYRNKKKQLFSEIVPEN